MLKSLLLFLFIISISYCLQFESSRLPVLNEDFKNGQAQSQKFHLNVDKIDYDVHYGQEAAAADESEYEGGKLIGKWRSTGDAIEPKWRDGDSIPLVPFEEAATLRRVTKNKENKPTTLNVQRDLTTHNNPLVSKFHEIQQAKIRYLNAPVTEIKPIPEFISAFKDIKAYAVEEPIHPIRQSDFTGSFQNDSRIRYRIRKPKPSAVFPEEGTTIAYIRKSTIKHLPTSSTESNKLPAIDDRRKNQISTTTLPEKIVVTVGKPNNNLFGKNSEYEFNDEEYQRPRPRKRRPPSNLEFSDSVKNSDATSNGYRRRPENVSRKNRTQNFLENEKINKRMENSELKSLLKMQQIEGLSLSEILQRRNLSLSDLLKGRSDIIKVLKSNDTNDDVESVNANNRANNVLLSPIVLRDKPVDRPIWRTSNQRTRLKDSKRNQFHTEMMTTSTMTTPVTSTTSTTSATKSRKSYWSETKDDLNNADVIELMRANEGKLKESDMKSSTKAIAKLTESVLFARFNSSVKKSLLTSTTSRNVVDKDPEIIYEPKKQLAAAINVDDDEIMEFSDFPTKPSNLDDTLTTLSSITTSRPVVTSPRHDETTVIAGYNDIERHEGSTLSIEYLLSTQPAKPSVTTASTKSTDEDHRSNSLIEYNKSDNGANCNDANLMDYQNDGRNDRYEDYDDEEIAEGEEEEYYESFESSTPISDMTTISMTTDDAETTEESFDEGSQNQRPVLSVNNKTYEQVISEIEPEARAEIFELISSGSSAQRLEKILRSRNMSIDELISLRQRGSSKVHLASFARTKSRPQKVTDKPTTVQSATTKNIKISTPTNANPTHITTLRPFGFKIKINNVTIQPVATSTETIAPITDESVNIKGQKIDTNKSQTVFVTDKTPIVINISCSDEQSKDKIHAALEKNSLELADLLNAFDSLPFAIYKNKNRDVISTSTEANSEAETVEDNQKVDDDLADTNVSLRKEKALNNVVVLPDSLEIGGSVEEILDKFKDADIQNSTTELDLAEIIHEKERKTLSRIKPSIIASGVILGMTIVGFLALFITCRIKQKQRYIYKNNFSKAVFQAPVMNGRKLSNSSSLNTIMVNVVATSTTKRTVQQETQQVEQTFDYKSDIDHDSLDANDSWETIPDFMK